jgi:hypothetical protein
VVGEEDAGAVNGGDGADGGDGGATPEGSPEGAA